MRKIFYTCAVIILLVLFSLNIAENTYSIGYVLRPSYKWFIKSDTEYKKQIIKQSKLPNLTIDDLTSVVGPYELEEFIIKNTNNPQIYTPSQENREKGIFQANFHSHTKYSDGRATVEEMLDMANDYAKTIAPKPFYIAITDHNTVNSGKHIVELLDKDPNKYKNLKIVLGMEVFSIIEPIKDVLNSDIEIHLVSLAINPYDKQLNKIFKINPYVHNNYSYRTFDNAIILLNLKGLVGIAHPARSVSSKRIPDYKKYINFLFERYTYLTANSFSFVEAYYQSYKREKSKVINYINDNCEVFGIKKSGSIDNHGRDLFNKKGDD